MKSAQRDAHKAFLRNKLRHVLAGMSPESRRRKSRTIVSKVIRLKSYRNAQRIMIYASLPGEVRTWGLIRRSLKLGKEVFLPRLTNRGSRMIAVRVRNLEKDLVKGSYGILEPRGRRSKTGTKTKPDLIFVPGLAFDLKGHRLGRGKGFFDRYLAGYGTSGKIGLAFREQIVKKIPVCARDVNMDAVITD